MITLKERESKYTSLTLSNKLSENRCELRSSYSISVLKDDDSTAVFSLTPSHICDGGEWKFFLSYDILNDICGRYCEKFFGKTKSHSQQVIKLMRKGGKQEAEEYIWEHCLFNNRNFQT